MWMGRRPLSQLEVEPASSDRTITYAQVAMIIFLLGQQLVVSALGIERAPVFTNYPMYSYTFSSPAEFNAWLPPVYRIVVTTDEGRVELSCRPNSDLAEQMDAAVAGSAEAAAAVWRAVGACRGNLQHARGVTIEEDRRFFDWDRMMFTITPAVSVHGPLAATAQSVAAATGR
jgi:hypothetical protein